MKHEIIERRLYQADADHAIFGELAHERLLPALVIDMAGECRPNLQSIDRDIAYMRWRIPDGDYLPDMKRLAELARFAYCELRRGVTIVSMCGAGCNRSGLLAGLILMAHLRCDGSEAIDRIRRANPLALSNPTFVAFLRGMR